MWYVFVNVLLYSSVSWQFYLSKPKLLLICGCKYIVRIYYYVYFSQKHYSFERCVQMPIDMMVLDTKYALEYWSVYILCFSN